MNDGDATRQVLAWVENHQGTSSHAVAEAAAAAAEAAVEALIRNGALIRQAGPPGGSLVTPAAFRRETGTSPGELLERSSRIGQEADSAHAEHDAKRWMECLQAQAAGQVAGNSKNLLDEWEAIAWLAVHTQGPDTGLSSLNAVELRREGANAHQAAAEVAEAIQKQPIDTEQAGATQLAHTLKRARFLIGSPHGLTYVRIAHVWIETEHGAAIAAFRYVATVHEARKSLEPTSG